MKLKKKKTRRCDTKVVTKEATVLKYFRESRRLSVRKAAKLLNFSYSTLNHIENGRKDLSTNLILKIVQSYGYSYEQYEGVLKGDYEMPEHLRNECVRIIERLDESKLKTVKAFLITF